MAIHTLSIDVETFSDVDLKKCGVYKYAESPDFEILLFGVSVDGGEVTVYDLASGDTVPEEIIQALADDSVIKWAYNASFERVCLSVWLRRNYPQYFSSYSIEEDTVRNYLELSAVFFPLQHRGRYRPELPRPVLLALLLGMGRVHGAAPLSGGDRQSPQAGKPEDG